MARSDSVDGGLSEASWEAFRPPSPEAAPAAPRFAIKTDSILPEFVYYVRVAALNAVCPPHSNRPPA